MDIIRYMLYEKICGMFLYVTYLGKFFLHLYRKSKIIGLFSSSSSSFQLHFFLSFYILGCIIQNIIYFIFYIVLYKIYKVVLKYKINYF